MLDIQLYKKRKKELGITFEELAKRSNLPQSTIYDIFRGVTAHPRIDTVAALEKALELPSRPVVDTTERAKTVDINAEVIGAIDVADSNPIPLLGSVAAGVPIESQEDLEGYIYVNYKPREEYFALRVHGESMIGAGIRDNSVLVVHKQAWAESGEIVVAMLNGKQTVKRLKCYGKGKNFLMPENPAFEPVPILEGDDLIILGKVVEMRVTF